MPKPPTYQTVSVADSRTGEPISLFYRESGPKDAPVVLLLHGFPTSNHQYRDLIGQLSDKYRVIAPDLPGFGFSDAPTPRVSATPSTILPRCSRAYRRDRAGPLGPLSRIVQRVARRSALGKSRIEPVFARSLQVRSFTPSCDATAYVAPRWSPLSSMPNGGCANTMTASIPEPRPPVQTIKEPRKNGRFKCRSNDAGRDVTRACSRPSGRGHRDVRRRDCARDRPSGREDVARPP
jgi:hypothetical protein